MLSYVKECDSIPPPEDGEEYVQDEMVKMKQLFLFWYVLIKM